MWIELLPQHFSPRDTPLSILDLGCGRGPLVSLLREQGHDAFGCDIPDSDASDFCPDSTAASFLRPIELRPYRLPFSSDRFDCVISNQVLEHVMDYESTFREIHRVLKPGGISLHSFPCRWRFIEPHVFVPLATIIQSKAWLYLWAAIGIRNQYQVGKSAAEVTELNFNYLNNHTNYLSKKEIRRHAQYFTNVSFRQDVFFPKSFEKPKNQSRRKRVLVFLRGDRLRAWIRGTGGMRFLFLQK